jgi:undecaprenyl diphosphate synthase
LPTTRIDIRIPTVGAQKVIDIVKYVYRTDVEVLTLFLFSTENWKRPGEEVSNVMGLLEEYLKAFATYLVENNVRVEIIGQVGS